MAMDISNADFERLSNFIKQHYGIDLTQKRQLITSRLSAPLQAKGFHNFTDYVNHLLKNRREEDVSMLLDKVTTNYTYFMRETDHFEYFISTILPDLVARHQKDKVLSIWSAGCSSGEEPYNLSMYMLDYLGSAAAQWDTRILATDISQRALTAAQKGIYELPDTVPEKWRKSYFVKQGTGDLFAVAPAIRNNVIFRTFNLMDPIRFNRKFDVIFCRNVMIYFDGPTKEALVNRFYDATVPNGHLLISYSENLSNETKYTRVAAATYRKM